VFTSFEEHLLKRKLTLSYFNEGPQKYVGKVTVIVPSDSGFSNYTVLVGNYYSDYAGKIETFDQKKGLTLEFEIMPSESKTINLEWDSNTEDVSQYIFNLSKQPGVESFPITFFLNGPSANLLPDSNFVLTGDGVYEYNTVLSGDTTYKVELKNESN
jgi:hypothetical protein